MPEIPPLGEMSRSDKRGAVSARRKLSRSGATRLKRLEVVLRTNSDGVEGGTLFGSFFPCRKKELPAAQAKGYCTTGFRCT